MIIKKASEKTLEKKLTAGAKRLKGIALKFHCLSFTGFVCRNHEPAKSTPRMAQPRLPERRNMGFWLSRPALTASAFTLDEVFFLPRF